MGNFETRIAVKTDEERSVVTLARFQRCCRCARRRPRDGRMGTVAGRIAVHDEDLATVGLA
jgi:hypothetical protein